MAHDMTDCCIIGGGIIGMMSAIELSTSGMHVTVLERGRAGTESSWAGGGILTPIYPWEYPTFITELGRWSQQQYVELSVYLQHRIGIDIERIVGGMIVLDADQASRATAWAAAEESVLSLITAEEMLTYAPRLAADLPQHGIWMPEAAHLRNPRLMTALRKLLPEIGVQLIEDCSAESIILQKHRVAGVATPTGDIACETVVVAAGCWSQDLLTRWIGESVIRPIRGQILLYECEHQLMAPIVVQDGNYVIPRKDGCVLVGSTLEDVGYDKSVTEAARTKLTAVAEKLVPELTPDRIVRQWSGLRPGSPQGAPLISQIHGVAGLFVNSGHYRNGILLGPGSAKLLADLVLERDPVVDPRPFQANDIQAADVCGEPAHCASHNGTPDAF